MKKFFKILGIVLGILAVIALIVGACIYFFILQYPEIKENPEPGKWYRVSEKGMLDSEGNDYRALFKKGTDDNVLIYFAGGGVSVNEEMARDDTYNNKEIGIDYLANVTMNMGGLATEFEGNPFDDWNIILFPYATGDFHAGAGEFPYTDKDGKEKILYHNGYNNYKLGMDKIMKYAGFEHVNEVVVTGYSAGGFGAALLADDVFSNYFPEAESKTVLVDASLLLNDKWPEIAADVWQSPESITQMLHSNNITLDCIEFLNNKYGDGIHLLFDSSTRDGDLAKVQNYFDNGIMDVDEETADRYQEILKRTIPEFENQNVSLFIWDGVPWYDDPRNMTAHTIIATPAVWVPFEEQKQSVAGWLEDAIKGDLKNYGTNLVNKDYPKTKNLPVDSKDDSSDGQKNRN